MWAALSSAVPHVRRATSPMSRSARETLTAHEVYHSETVDGQASAPGSPSILDSNISLHLHSSPASSATVPSDGSVFDDALVAYSATLVGENMSTWTAEDYERFGDALEVLQYLHEQSPTRANEPLPARSLAPVAAGFSVMESYIIPPPRVPPSTPVFSDVAYDSPRTLWQRTFGESSEEERNSPESVIMRETLEDQDDFSLACDDQFCLAPTPAPSPRAPKKWWRVGDTLVPLRDMERIDLPDGSLGVISFSFVDFRVQIIRDNFFVFHGFIQRGAWLQFASLRWVYGAYRVTRAGKVVRAFEQPRWRKRPVTEKPVVKRVRRRERDVETQADDVPALSPSPWLTQESWDRLARASRGVSRLSFEDMAAIHRAWHEEATVRDLRRAVNQAKRAQKRRYSQSEARKAEVARACERSNERAQARWQKMRLNELELQMDHIRAFDEEADVYAPAARTEPGWPVLPDEAEEKYDPESDWKSVAEVLKEIGVLLRSTITDPVWQRRIEIFISSAVALRGQRTWSGRIATLFLIFRATYPDVTIPWQLMWECVRVLVRDGVMSACDALEERSNTFHFFRNGVMAVQNDEVPVEGAEKAVMATVEQLCNEMDGFTTLKALRESPLIGKLRNVTLALAVVPFCAYQGITPAVRAVQDMLGAFSGPSGYASSPLLGAAMAVFDMLDYLRKGAWKFFISGETDWLYPDGSRHKWLTKAAEVLAMQNSLVPEYEALAPDFDAKVSMTYTDFIRACEELEGQAGALIKADAKAALGLASMLYKIRVARLRVVSTRQSEGLRFCPWAVLVVSGAGVGKTVIVQQIIDAVNQAGGFEDSPASQYSGTPGEKFLSNYSPHHTHCIFDELGAQSQSIRMPDESINRLLPIISSNRYIVDDPVAERKGTIPFLSKTVICMSNCKDLGLIHKVEHPEAIMRRFRFVVTVEVKPEFRFVVEDEKGIVSTQVDSAKVMAMPPGTPIHNYHIERPYSIGGQYSFLTVARLSTTAQFLRVIKADFTAHSQSQYAYLKTARVHGLPRCPECSLPVDWGAAHDTCAVPVKWGAKTVVEVLREMQLGAGVAPPPVAVVGEVVADDEDGEEEKEADPAVQNDEVKARAGEAGENITIRESMRLFEETLASNGLLTWRQRFSLATLPFKIAAGAFVGSVGQLRTFQRLHGGADLSWRTILGTGFRAARAAYTARVQDAATALSTRFAMEVKVDMLNKLLGGVMFAAIAALAVRYVLASRVSKSETQGDERSAIPSVARGGPSEYHVRPSVTAPTTRWTSVSPGFEVPEYAFDEYRASANIDDLAKALAARVISLGIIPHADGIVDATGKISASATMRTQVAIPLGGQLVLTCAHGFIDPPAVRDYSIMVVRKRVPGLGDTHTVTVPKTRIATIDGADACVVDLGHGMALPDCSKWFVDGRVGTFTGYESRLVTSYIVARSGEHVRDAAVSTIVASDHGKIAPRLADGTRIAVDRSIHYALDSKRGMSGSPVVAAPMTGGGKCGPPFIYGIHFCGEKGLSGHACPITRGDLADAKAKLSGALALASGCVTQMKLVPVSTRSFLNNFSTGTCIPLGTESGYHASRPGGLVFPTMMSPHVDTLRYPNLWEAPDCRGRMEGSEFVDPYMVNLSPIIQLPQQSSFAADLMGALVERYYKARHDVSPFSGTGFGPQSLFEAINGKVGALYIDALNFTSSGGYGFRGPKIKYFTGVPGERAMCSELQKEYERIVECYARRVRAYPVFTATLKQEPVKVEKNRAGGVRVFGAAPLAFGLLFRQFYQPVIAFIMSNRWHTGVAVGMNAISTEWKQLYELLVTFGAKRAVGGDYSKYDKRMGSHWIQRAFRVMIWMAREFGAYSETDLEWMEFLAHEITYHVLMVRGDVMVMCDSNPSGQSATVIVNSIVNIMYIFYVAWRVQNHDEVATVTFIKDHVRFMVYGDDNVLCSDDDRMSHGRIAELMTEIGQVYTMADKGRESVPFIGMDEVTFLKRGFRFDDETGIMMAPLVEESIAKMLHWRVKSALPEKQQCAQLLQDASEQYFMYGRSTFMERQGEMQRIARACGLSDLVRWQTFDDLVAKYQLGELGQSASSCEVDAAVSVAIRETETQSGELVIQVGMRRTHAGATLCIRAVDVIPLTALVALAPHIKLSGGASIKQLADQNNVPQAEVTASVKIDETQVQQTVAFDDAHATEHVAVGGSLPTNVQSLNDPVILGKFLERPIKFLSGTWTTGAGQLHSINPWQAFLTNAAVLKKLDNFQYVRGTLHARLIVNASPFHYGLLAMTYWPFKDDISTELSMDINRAVQLPHVFVNPAGGASVELTMPFVNQRNYINLAVTGLQAAEYARATGLNMGRLEIEELVPLALANQAGATQVEYALYFWMTDVDLQMATPYPVITQAGDEYVGEGVISKPASVVAGWAAWFKDMPVIGKFARATEIGASAVGKIATLFGFSRPLLLEDVRHFKPRLFGPLAFTEGRDNAYGLTLDPKNEVTIDPCVIGLPGQDSMALGNITAREGVVAFFDWQGADTAGTMLARLPVTPTVVDATDGAVNPSLQRIRMTPIAFASLPFRYWTGSLEYRIQFVATQYHRGRVRVTYFPSANAILPAVDYTNLAHNHIIDLSETREVVLKVGWAQANPWGSTAPVYGSWATPDSSYSGTHNTANGYLLIDVINQLRAPLDPSTVKVIVTVRGGPDFRLAVPEMDRVFDLVSDGTLVRTNHPSSVFNFDVNTYTRTGPEPVVQSGEVPMSIDVSPPVELVPSLGDVTVRTQLHIGEEVASLRSLFKRSFPQLRAVMTHPANDSTTAQYLTALPSRLWDWASNNSPIGSSTIPGRFLIPQHPIAYFAPAFAATRGSLRWRILEWTVCEDVAGALRNQNPPFSAEYILVRLERDNVTAMLGTISMDFGFMGTNGNAGRYFNAMGNGSEMLQTHIQPGTEFQVPYYYPLNFKLAGAFTRSAADTSGGEDVSGGALETVGYYTCTTQSAINTSWENNFATFQVFCSAGEDFTLDWFVCTPTMFSSSQDQRRIAQW